MAQLEYKTRGNSTPQGKARVFFCCHPEDREVYLDEIAADVLEAQNCAVWYDPDPLAPYDREALRESISQMQLMVICVTRKLLTQPSRALQLEYAWAQEYHIPVLPLMQERGLDGLFARRFGDVQYLNKHITEEGALSFQEKLAQFLAGVLVQDEEAEKIRAAFDGYIFLSYRKKDRRHARELMRLIHQQDFCRDVAIWYDEFLTPGEDFNREIERALDKSALFAMAITPNVAEEGNYIMTTEYPLARKRKKPILPVEMIPTESNSVEACYESLPAVVKASDGDALRGGLKAALAELPLRQKEDTPEHLYLMGLAYLGGVDVEVDAKRAVEMFTLAAKEKHIPALQKLIAMYENGQGVAVNPDEAIKWRRELIRVYFLGPVPGMSTWEKMRNHIFAIYQLATYLEGLGRWDEAFEEYKNLRLHSGSRWDTPRDEDMAHLYFVEMLLAAKGYEGQCDYWCERGDYRKALKCARSALDIFEEGVKRKFPLETTGLTPAVTLSDVYMHLGEIREATACISCYRDHLKKAQHEESAVVAHNYLLSPARRAQIFWREGQEAEAVALWRAIIAIRRNLIERSKEPMLWHGYLQALMGLAEVLAEMEEREEAERCYRQAIEVAQRLSLFTASDLADINEKEGWQGLGYLYAEAGDLPKALECYQRAASLICSRTASDDTMVEFRQFARVCMSWQEHDEAVTLLSHALSMLARGSKGDKSITTLRRRAALLEDYGLALSRAGHHREACDALYEAETLRQKVYKKTGATLDGNMLGRVRTDLGRVLRDAGEEGQAKRKLKEALTQLEKLRRERDGAYLRRSIRECERAMRGGEETTPYSEVLAEQVRVAREEPEGRFAMADRYLYFAGSLHRVDGGEKDAYGALTKARQILVSLVNQGAQVPMLGETLDGCLLTIGHTCMRLGQYAEAEEAYVELLSRLVAAESATYGEDLPKRLEKTYLALLGLYRREGRTQEMRVPLEGLLELRRGVLLCDGPALGNTYFALALYLRAVGDAAGACEALDRAEAARHVPEGQTPTVGSWWRICQVRRERADLCAAIGDTEGHVASRKGVKDALWAIDLLWDKEARAARQMGNYKKAQAIVERCISLEEGLVAEFSSPTLRSNLSISYLEMGGIYETLGDNEEHKNRFNLSYDYKSANAYWAQAWGYYKKAADLRAALWQETGNLKYARTLAAAYAKVAGVAAAGDDPVPPIEYHDRVIALREEIFKAEPSDEAKRALGDAYNVKGNALSDDHPDEALALYDAALAIRMPLAEQTGSERDLDALANTYYNLAASLSVGDGSQLLSDALQTAREVALRCYGQEAELAPRGTHLKEAVRRQVAAYYTMAAKTWEELISRYPATAAKRRDSMERAYRYASQYNA